MEKLENLLNLVKEAGFKADYSFDNRKVNIYNDEDELVGQMAIFPDNKTWFYVYDTKLMEITLEGGEFKLNVDSIKDIIAFFRNR